MQHEGKADAITSKTAKKSRRNGFISKQITNKVRRYKITRLKVKKIV